MENNFLMEIGYTEAEINFIEKERFYIEEINVQRSLKEYSNSKPRQPYCEVSKEEITTKDCKAKNKVKLRAIEFFPEMYMLKSLFIVGPIVTITRNTSLLIGTLSVFILILITMIKLIACRRRIKNSQNGKTELYMKDIWNHEKWHAEVFKKNKVACNFALSPIPTITPKGIISKRLCLKALLSPFIKGCLNPSDKLIMRFAKALTFSKSDIYFFFKIFIDFRCIAVEYPNSEEIIIYHKVK